jgi:hypothetical protein
MTTHRRGGHLDNFWTKIPATKVEFIDGLEHISEHSLNQVTIELEKR